MLTKFKTLSAIVAFCTFSAFTIEAQQLKVPAPSPLQTIKQAFALSEVSIEYSRPSAKGRTIFGDLVPYGKLWRTGANASTKITFGDDVKVEGVDLKAGTYAVYSIPNKDSWDIMFYNDLKMGGNVADYKKENEVLKISVKPKALNDKVETFSIQFADITATNVNVEFSWDKTRVAFKVESDIDSRIMKNIDASLATDGRPYFQAASYYYDNNKDLAKASEWVEKGIANNPKAYWMVLLKAKIQAKQGDKKTALATAEKVKQMATEDKNEDYVALADKFIAENKK